MRVRSPPAPRAASGSAPGQDLQDPEDHTAVRTNGMRRLTRYGVIVAAGMIAAGCTAGSQSSSSPSSGSSNKAAGNSSLTISNEAGQLWSCGFNPLNPTFTMLSYGFVYEPLVYVNPLQQGKTTPMLASSYAWSNGNKTLTFTIRSGVKWNDGTPMTANDVAYTFNLTKQYPAINLDGVNPSSVTTSGSTVTLTFATSQYMNLENIAGEAIVP